MPRLFCATAEAALELIPNFEVEEDRKYLHDAIAALDLGQGPCVIEIIALEQNNKGLHRGGTWFLRRSPESVTLHPVRLHAAHAEEQADAEREHLAMIGELDTLRAFKASHDATERARIAEEERQAAERPCPAPPVEGGQV